MLGLGTHKGVLVAQWELVEDALDVSVRLLVKIPVDDFAQRRFKPVSKSSSRCTESSINSFAHSAKWMSLHSESQQPSDAQAQVTQFPM